MMNQKEWHQVGEDLLKKLEARSDKVISFKVDSEENSLNSQSSLTNGVDSVEPSKKWKAYLRQSLQK